MWFSFCSSWSSHETPGGNNLNCSRTHLLFILSLQCRRENIRQTKASKWPADTLFQGIFSFSPQMNFIFWPTWFHRLYRIPMWPCGPVHGRFLTQLKCVCSAWPLTDAKKSLLGVSALGRKKKKKKTVIRETVKEALTGNERVGVIVFSMRHVHMCALCLCRMHGRQKISQRWIYTGENKKLGFHKQASDLLAGLERCVLTMRCYVSRGNSRSLKKALGIWAAVDSSLGLWCAHRSVVHPINSFVLQVWLRSYKLTCTFSQNTLLEGCNIHLILIKYSTMSIHSILTKCMI